MRLVFLSALLFLLQACIYSEGTLYESQNSQSFSDSVLMTRPATPMSESTAVLKQKSDVVVVPTQLDFPVLLVHSELPPYPPELQLAGIQGVVHLEFIVNEDGNVQDALVTKSPDSRLSELCINAVRTWRFAPMTFHGKPTKVKMLQRFPFRLEY